METLEHAIKVGVLHLLRPIRPHRKDAAWNQHPLRFGIERIEIQPVQRLRNRHQGGRCFCQPARLRGRNTILHTRVTWSLNQHCGTDVGGDYAIEPAGERNRSLPGPGRAIPRKLPIRS
jgi:hypothetical protein